MAAIAYGAESGGNPTATNPSGATGLWQIEVPGSSGGYTAAQLMDPLTNAKRAVELLGNGSGISNWGQGTGDAIGTAVQANGNKPLTPQQAQQYATNPPVNATLDAMVTTTTPTTSTTSAAPATPAAPGSLTVGAAEPSAGGVSSSGNLAGASPSTTNQAPMAGVDLSNFHGYDLTKIPQAELGNTEYAIQEYVTDPSLQAKINQDMQQNFGYQSWATKIPQLNAVLIAAATQGWNENTFIGAVTATDWWAQTNQNQRAWQQMQGDDPATAHELLTQSKEKALATANQLGVTLTAKQLDAIGNYIASGTATQSGVLGAVSGTLQEQIDQQVVYAATGQKQKGVNYATGLSSSGDLQVATQQGTNPSNLFGTSEYLYDQFKQIAQNYMMYSSSASSPLDDKGLMSYVESAMQNFTGSNSFGNSNLEQGAIANFTEQMQQQASSLYPSMATAINKMGVTPATYVQPIQNLIANTLGTTADNVDLTSPQYNWAIAIPPGATQAPTQDQILQKLVTTPEYDSSNNAVSNAKTITSGLAAQFGVGGL